jgi:hypothetical protein
LNAGRIARRVKNEKGKVKSFGGAAFRRACIRFANVRQIPPGFAKHWQIHPPCAVNILPILGKIT